LEVEPTRKVVHCYLLSPLKKVSSFLDIRKVRFDISEVGAIEIIGKLLEKFKWAGAHLSVYA
jgi:hypothetical protein